VPGRDHDGFGVNAPLNVPVAETVTVWLRRVAFTGFVILSESVLPAANEDPVTVPEKVPEAFPT
jgi:hypothetical protein